MRPAVAHGAAVVVATLEHRRAVVGALSGAGVDTRAAVLDGRLVLLDADRTLARVLVDDVPDARAFRRVLGGVVEGAAARGPVRVYGEMVALLWEQGKVAAAIALEDLWNDLGTTHAFDLLCGYPSALFRRHGRPEHADAVCRQHAGVTTGWQLPAQRTSGAWARARLRELLVSCDAAELLDRAELVATELINNAVVHARSEVQVGVTYSAGTLRVEVADHGRGSLRPSFPRPDSTHGRGLLLVEAMASAWGTNRGTGPGGTGKTVWFELRRDAAG